MQEVKVDTYEELNRLVAGIIGQETNPYSEHVSYALQALETFPLWEITKQKGGYRVLFYEMRELTNATRRNDLTSAIGKTLPLAICYAILQFKGLVVV